MTNCSEFDDWDNRTHEERLEALDHLINEKLYEEGYDPVVVEDGDLGGDLEGTIYGETDADGHTIRIDSDHLDYDSEHEVVDTSLHEAEHARELQDGDYDYGDEDMLEDEAWAEGFVGEMEWDEECQPDPESSSEDEVDFDWESIGGEWW